MRASAWPIVMGLWASTAGADPTQVTLGAEVGGGSVNLSGTRYGTADGGIELAAARWISPNLGIGVRLTDLVAMPLRDARMDGYPIDRELPWTFIPELLARTTPVTLGPARFGWLATAGAGVAWLRTNELCGGGGSLFDDEDVGSPCIIVKERSTALAGALGGGGYLDVGHFAMFLGARADADTGGDRTLGLVATLGAIF